MGRRGATVPAAGERAVGLSRHSSLRRSLLSCWSLSMKTSIHLILFTSVTAAFGQGVLVFDNWVPPGDRFIPVYGPDPSNPSLSLSGQSSIGAPPGTTVY